MIPVYVSPNGLDYIHEKNITLKELMRIKDVCKNHPSDHYISHQEQFNNLVTISIVQPLRLMRKPNRKKYVHLSNVYYQNIINATQTKSGIGSSKRENIIKR